MKGLVSLAAFLIAASLAPIAEAQVHVRSYTRSDGTYVRPHIRSAPDSTTANNYGPSRGSSLYSPSLPNLATVSPQTRDHDQGGLANLYDGDDDNDGVGDDADQSQYGAVFQSPGWWKH